MDNNTLAVEENDWEVDLSTTLPEDPLLACLMLCTKIFRKPLTASALLMGLPFIQNRMTPNLFIRAAERADYSAQIAKREFASLNNSLLPAVLLLSQQKACILLEISKEGMTRIIQPEVGSGVTEVSAQTLAKEYSGYTIFIRPSFQFTNRATEALAPMPKHWFWSVMWKTWPIYSEVIVASLLINIFAMVVPLFVMNVYDRVVPNFAVTTLWVFVSGVFLVMGFDFGLRTLRSHFVDIAAKNVDIKLSSSIFEQVLGIKMDVRPRSVGSFVNTVYSFESFREFITSTTMTVVSDLPFSLLYLIVIAMLGGPLVYIPMVGMPLALLVGFLIQIPLRKLTDVSQKQAAEKQATLIETLGNIETVKTVCGESTLQHRYEQVVSQASKTGIKLRSYANLNVNYTLFIQQLSYVMVIVFGVYMINTNSLTTGGLIACSMLTSRALAPMGQIAALLTRYHQAMSALRSLEMVMNLPVEKPPHKAHVHARKLAGDIELRGVDFVYPQQLLPVLHKVSFKIKPGDKVGIIGRIGSGKSTIAKIILNLYQPSAGTVFIDGKESNQLDTSVLRQQIGYVPQDVALFYGTVKDNITFGMPHVDNQAILQAAKLSGLDAFVSRHPKGYDLEVGERGYNLSGGQRQTVVITRALLLDPPIFLFDELTNAMDDTTENILKTNLTSYLENKTLVLITHKVSLLTMVNRLIIMDNGSVVADGPKDEILKALSEGRVKVPTGKLAVVG